MLNMGSGRLAAAKKMEDWALIFAIDGNASL
jgi:hypothetical protein